jgi:hypothetical protein
LRFGWASSAGIETDEVEVNHLGTALLMPRGLIPDSAGSSRPGFTPGRRRGHRASGEAIPSEYSRHIQPTLKPEDVLLGN